MYTEDENAENFPQNCFFAEAEEDWLLVDVELTEEDALILKEYVVINEQNVASVIEQRKNCGKRLPDGQLNQEIVEKSRKYFHGKMISRLVPRKMMEPYKIMRPLKWSKSMDEKCNAHKFQKMNSWLEILSLKVPRTLGTVESIPAVRVNVKSLNFPDAPMEISMPVLEPVKLQPKHAYPKDLCTAVVEFEPSPNATKNLWDSEYIKRKRSFDFVAKIRGDSSEVALRMTLDQDHVCDLLKLSIRKRRKYNPVTSTSDLLAANQVDAEPAHTPKPLLAIEWQPERLDPPSALMQESDPSEDDEGDKWFMRPAVPMFSDLCEKTSQLSSRLGHQIPRAAMFLWAQILQLLSCSKKLLSLKTPEEEGFRNVIFREPHQRGYLRSVSCKDYCEERGRASMQKKTKRHDSKKSLKRAHGALTQKYYHNTNRKRAMDSTKFQGACGRRGC